MKVIYIKDFTGQQKGNVINTDKGTADFLVKKGVCELYKKIEKVTAHKQQVLIEVPKKKKGNPNFGKKKV